MLEFIWLGFFPSGRDLDATKGVKKGLRGLMVCIGLVGFTACKVAVGS